VAARVRAPVSTTRVKTRMAWSLSIGIIQDNEY
jgi:hypothetical protein